MHSAPEHLPVAAAISLRRPPRDTRLDIVRGWLQLTIMASHVGGFASVWLIHAAWGYSDSSEQFVLLSGLMLGSVFTLKRLRDGWVAAWCDMLLRAARLWRTRLTTLLCLGAMLIALDLTVTQGEARAYGFLFLMQAPLRAAATAAGLLYNPAYVDVLTVFIVGMLTLPLFLLAVERIGAWALIASLLLWLAVQIGHLPAPDLAPDAAPAFNVLAWQVLFLLGSFFGRRKLLHGDALPAGRWLTWVSGGIVAVGIVTRISEYMQIGLGVALPVIDGYDKLELSPLRLGHALALAIFVARVIPMQARWMSRWPASVLAAIGRHSLHVYCLGIFVAFAIARILEYLGPVHRWAEAPLIAFGFTVLGYYAVCKDGHRWRFPSFSVARQIHWETR